MSSRSKGKRYRIVGFDGDISIVPVLTLLGTRITADGNDTRIVTNGDTRVTAGI